MGLINLYKKLKLNKLVSRAIENPELLSTDKWWTEFWKTFFGVKEIRIMLAGYKTYIIAAAIAAVTVAHATGLIDDNTYNTLMSLLASGGVATLAAKINRGQKEQENNTVNVKKLLILLPLILIPNLVYAQQPPPGSLNQKFAWDQSAPTLVEAQGYTYKYYPDNTSTGIEFNGVVCSGTVSPFTCSVNIPAFTPGTHTITLTATNVAGESPKSTPFGFVFVVTPSIPSNIRIISQ